MWCCVLTVRGCRQVTYEEVKAAMVAARQQQQGSSRRRPPTAARMRVACEKMDELVRDASFDPFEVRSQGRKGEGRRRGEVTHPVGCWLCVQRREGRVMGLNESEPRLVAFTNK